MTDNKRCDTEERFLLDSNGGWKDEAEAVIKDVNTFVKRIEISTVLPCNEAGVYLNVQTKESQIVTVELTQAGYRICGHSFDRNDITDTVYYETAYALLSTISPEYRLGFVDAVIQRLNSLPSN